MPRRSCINRKYFKHRMRRLVRKLKVYLGCKICHYKICGDALEYHHLSGKKEEISSLVSRDITFARLKRELSKCIVLCSNCHREVHYFNESYLNRDRETTEFIVEYSGAELGSTGTNGVSDACTG